MGVCVCAGVCVWVRVCVCACACECHQYPMLKSVLFIFSTIFYASFCDYSASCASCKEEGEEATPM